MPSLWHIFDANSRVVSLKKNSRQLNNDIYALLSVVGRKKRKNVPQDMRFVLKELKKKSKRSIDADLTGSLKDRTTNRNTEGHIIAWEARGEVSFRNSPHQKKIDIANVN